MSGSNFPYDINKFDMEYINDTNGKEDEESDEWGECDCGHSEKVHFEHTGGCAGEDGGGCECEGYEPTVTRGKQ